MIEMITFAFVVAVVVVPWITLRSRVVEAVEKLNSSTGTTPTTLPVTSQPVAGINVLDPEDFPEGVRALLQEAAFRDLYSAEELRELKAEMAKRSAA